VRFDLAREVGHYVMDYFVPSILLVVVSWVSFWLDPNAVPGRTTLGKVPGQLRAPHEGKEGFKFRTELLII
jgi:hypothetical protein